MVDPGKEIPDRPAEIAGSLMSGIDPAVASVLQAQEAALKSQVQYAVAGKQLDATEQQGDAANALLEQSLQLSKAIGRGESFEATA